MSNTEITREPLVVGDVTYKVVEIVWPDEQRSFDVYRDDTLLTVDESLDHYPTQDDIPALLDPSEDADTFPKSSCGCGFNTILTPDGWQHDAAPWFWGDDHQADG